MRTDFRDFLRIDHVSLCLSSSHLFSFIIRMKNSTLSSMVVMSRLPICSAQPGQTTRCSWVSSSSWSHSYSHTCTAVLEDTVLYAFCTVATGALALHMTPNNSTFYTVHKKYIQIPWRGWRRRRRRVIN